MRCCILLPRKSMWGVQERFSSIMTLKYLYAVTWLLSTLRIFTLRSGQVGGLPKIISSVFTELIIWAFLRYHSTNQSTFLWYSLGSSVFFNLVNKVESFEFFNRGWLGREELQSAMRCLKNTGELMRPWGTPTFVILGDDRITWLLRHQRELRMRPSFAYFILLWRNPSISLWFKKQLQRTVFRAPHVNLYQSLVCITQVHTQEFLFCLLRGLHYVI